MSGIIEQVKQAVLPVLDSLNVELVDIEFGKKYGEDNLTVYIYQQGGVTLDDCEKVHLAIDPVLDEVNPTGDRPYVLNVSSPGLDRPFKTGRDFERNYNTEVEIKLYAPLKGKKVYEGVLINHDENSTVIRIAAKGSPSKAYAPKDNVSKKNAVSNNAANDSAENGQGIEDKENAEKTTREANKEQDIKIENTRIAFVRPLVKF